MFRAVEIADAMLPKLTAAWEAHPDFGAVETRPGNPVAVAAFRHEPNRGHSYSFLIAPVSDLLTPKQIEWGEANMGDFAGIFPIRPEIPVMPYQIGRLSWSPKGRGKAYWARKTLKEVLPKKYHRLIGVARKLSRLPKKVHGDSAKGTRDDLNFGRFCDENADAVLGLSDLIAPREFWECATGKRHPNEIESKVVVQTDLF